MNLREQIEAAVAELPEHLQQAVYDFACFLQLRASADAFDGFALSESALSKDWSTREEDAAWADL